MFWPTFFKRYVASRSLGDSPTRHPIKRLFSTVFVFLLYTQPVKAGLALCNKSAIPFYAAVGYYDGATLETEGWWRIWPNNCATVTSGSITNMYYFYYAHSDWNFWTWSGDVPLCTSNTAFTIAQVASECSQINKFQKLDTGAGPITPTYTLNLTCASCNAPKVKYNKPAKTAIVYSVERHSLYGQDVYFPISGDFDFKIDDQEKTISGNASFDIDLSDFQKKFQIVAAAALNIDEECGDSFSLSNVSLSLSGETALVTADGNYARWLCTSMDLPQTTCTPQQVCVNKPPETVCWTGQQCFLGMCTDVPQCEMRGGGQACTDVPQCTTRMVTTSTGKNVIVRQSGSLVVTLSPRLVGTQSIQISPEVSDVRLNGLGQSIINLLGVNLKQKAQDMLMSNLDPSNLALAMPAEIRDVVALERVFFQGRNGGMHLIAKGKFKADSAQIVSLCQQFWPAGRCASTP